MKKLLLSAALIVFIGFTAASQSKFGILAGPSLSKVKTSKSGLTISSSTLVSFHAGFVMDAALTDNIYFQPQLLLSGKGGKVEFLGVKSQTNPFFIEIPFNFLYKAPAGAGRVFAGLGPYAGIGIFGKTKSDDESTDIQFGSGEEDDMKPFDFGANFIAGYEFDNGFLINANYSLGIADLSTTGKGDSSAKLQYLGISIGYFFSGGGRY